MHLERNETLFPTTVLLERVIGKFGVTVAVIPNGDVLAIVFDENGDGHRYRVKLEDVAKAAVDAEQNR